MTDRTFIQNGQAYGVTPCNIVAKLDGNLIYSGQVLTVNAPIPNFPDESLVITNQLFTWNENLTFAGTRQFEVEVSGSTLVLAGTFANFESGNAQVFSSFYHETGPDGTIYFDPFTNETINGIDVSHLPDPSYTGQWTWKIPAGSTFSATLNVLAGNVPGEEYAPPGPYITYP